MSTNAPYEYLKNAVLTASPEQLQLMLYDGAIRFASRGREALLAADYEGAFSGFERAQRIVTQLQTGLRREVAPELVDQMSALYNFIFRKLIDANTHRDPTAADDAIRILRHQRETWQMLIDKLARERSAPLQPAAAAPQARATKAPVAAVIEPRPSLSLEG